MIQEEDLCPINDNGNHRYFIFRVVEVFEPIGLDDLDIDMHLVELFELYKGSTLYEKIEYAISGCNCGSSIKQKVKNERA